MKVERPDRRKFRPISNQMKAWSAALSAELHDWPQIAQKSFFGFTALYRGKTMFGLLPRTRSIFTENAVAFRIKGANHSTQALLEKDSRMGAFDKGKTRWFAFEISSDADLHDALDYLSRAFEAARIPMKAE